MYKILILASLALVACGDTPKKSSSKISSNNTTSNNTSTNNAANNMSANNTSTNTNPNNAANNTSTNNVVVVNPTNNASNNNENNVVDPLTQKCLDYCELTLGSCVVDNCSLNSALSTARRDAFTQCLGVGADSCSSRYRSDLNFRSVVDNAPAGNCFDTDVEKGRCATFGFEACDCPLPTLGQSCTNANQCDPGYLTARCVSGDGFSECLAMGCNPGANPMVNSVVRGDGTGCGADNLCAVAEDSQTYCLKGCTSNSQCQDAFTCQLDLDFGQGPYGYCAPNIEVP